MPSIKAKDGQSLLDIALQECGAVEAVVDIALLNNISITSSLTPGQVVNIPESSFKNIDVLDYYKKKNIAPATAQLSPDIEALVALDDVDDTVDPAPIFGREYTFEYTQVYGSTI